MEVTENDLIEHRGYLLSLSLRCLSIYKNEKMKRHYSKQLFIEEAPENNEFFNPFGKTPLILNKLNITSHLPDKIGETKITPKGELIGRKSIIKTKLSASGSYICDPAELSRLLDIPVILLETNFNLVKEEGCFLFRFCFMTFGAALIYKGIRLKDDYYEDKFSLENFVGIGYRVHRIPDNVYKKSLLIFGNKPSFKDDSIWGDYDDVKQEVYGIKDDSLGGIPLQNKVLKYINKTQLMALKNNSLENEPIYKAWDKYALLNGNSDFKGLNIGNIWRLDNMLNQQDVESLNQETIDPIYYNPDNSENKEKVDIQQLKDNILNLTTKDIVDLQNKHSVLKTSHELNNIVKNRKQVVKRINSEMKLSYYQPKSRVNKEILEQFLHNDLKITNPEKVQQFMEKIIVKNDKKLISLLNEKKQDKESNEFWTVSNDSYDDIKRLQNIEIDFNIPNKNVFPWIQFMENEENKELE
ncbi:hypothetical protein ACO0SA_001123 [Hanseniaspora valbyensis]